ncbi:hypothetical protein ABZ934_00760 [Streptomyces sp. NPDC046557]|uniref:hypothetical protein n=1 Tax=Streptomyces sp. NPDC046557 TaxID=3155372 RepID=UPI0033CDEBEA
MVDGARRIRRVGTALLPVAAAAAVYGWASWCFAGSSAPSGAFAVVGGAVLILLACAAYCVLVGATGGFFGALTLSLGTLLVVAAADQAAERPAVARCAVREVHTKVQSSAGEGAPPERTVYRFVLGCPRGYPAELKEDRAVAAVGQEIRVAYDPARRVSPESEGETAPWKAASWAAVLLALSVTIAWAKRAPDREGRPASPGTPPPRSLRYS